VSWLFQDSGRAVALLPLVVKFADQLDETLLCAKFTTTVQDGTVTADVLVTVMLVQ
jgi:hypothetical protein